MSIDLPDGFEHVRTTDTFDQDHHPAGLRRAHRIADGVWARLVVRTGALTFVFEDDPGRAIDVAAGTSQVIPPGRLHRVDTAGPVTFELEFHRERDRAPLDSGSEKPPDSTRNELSNPARSVSAMSAPLAPTAAHQSRQHNRWSGRIQLLSRTNAHTRRPTPTGFCALITRRSQVQILPPPPPRRPGNSTFPGLRRVRAELGVYRVVYRL